MTKQTQKTAVPVIGASSLLVIFAVLCMTVFSLLGLSTVQADKRLSDIRAEAVEEYYAADCRGEEILAQLRSGQIPQGVTLSEGVYRYACPISPSQTLQVEVRADTWEILCWQAVSTVAWQAEESITVWDGTADSED